MKIPKTQSFVLQSGNTGFLDRQKALFDQLSQAEKDCNKDQTTSVNQADYDSNRFSRPPPPGKRRRSETRQFRGRESIFKQPELPSPFRRDKGIPDYHKNPHRWTKYSLDDVQTADMSDKSNTQAALSFLKELKARKRKNDNNEIKMQIDKPNRSNLEPSTSESSIIFKKPSQKHKEQKIAIEEHDKSPMFRGSKIILPEYVVGDKPVKPKKDKKSFTKVDRSKQMKLDHLEVLEEEDD